MAISLANQPKLDGVIGLYFSCGAFFLETCPAGVVTNTSHTEHPTLGCVPYGSFTRMAISLANQPKLDGVIGLYFSCGAFYIETCPAGVVTLPIQSILHWDVSRTGRLHGWLLA